MNNSEKGALGGGAVGAGIGALATRGSPGGALVGAALGAITGTVIGSAQDARQDQKAYAQAVVNAQAQRQMTLPEIVNMSQTKVPDQIIVNQINTSGSNFNLRGDDIIYLRQQGVSDFVISQMQVRRAPVAVMGPPPVVYVEQPPPPPPIGVGVGVMVR
jgi:hypothetical protein